MGWKEAAYLKYLSGGGGTLDGSSVPQETLPHLQEMAARAYMKRGNNQGQILYADYPESRQLGNNYEDVARTLGKTAPGNITREGNNWKIKDTYDFYSEGWDKDLDRAKNLLMGGDPIGALSAISPHVGKSMDVDVKIPMTAEQIQMFDRGSPIDTAALQKESFRFGGQDYGWKKYQLGRNDSAVGIASREFGNGSYIPEGSNLKKMVDMIYAKNDGKVDAGDTVWIPTQHNSQGQGNNLTTIDTSDRNAHTRKLPPSSQPNMLHQAQRTANNGLNLLNGYIGAISNGLKKEAGNIFRF